MSSRASPLQVEGGPRPPDADLALEVIEHGEGLFVLDPEFRLALVNETFERMSGRSRAEILGHVFWDVFPEAALAESRFWQEYRRAMRERVPVSFEEHYPPTGIWCGVDAYPLRDGGLAVFFRDVTAQRRADARAESLARFPEENPDPVLRISAELAIVYANPAALAAFRPLGLAHGAPAPPALAEPARAALAAGERRRVEIACGAALYQASIVPVGPEVNVYAQDITARKRVEDDLRASEAALRESADRFSTLADNIAQLAWMADEHGSVFWYNRRWLEYTGATFAEMEGWGWRKVHHPDHLARVEEKFRRHVASGEAWEDTFPLRRHDGAYRWFLSRALPIRDAGGKVVRWFGTNTDVTEQREAEQALREADQRKNEFLAVLSHELRGPLAPITNSIYLLEKLPTESAQAARARDVIRRQTGHLARLVEDLLDVTRISRGKIQLQREVVDLRELVRRACEDHRSTFERSRIDLRLEFPAAPLWVAVDETRIAQVAGNLLGNAAKFTPAGGAVTVGLRASAGRAELCVRDTGVGIEPEQLARMFEPFAQEERSLARTRGGLGLGLALSRGLVALHGGTITARSEGAGKGAELVVALPLAPRARDGAAPPPARAAGARRRVLLVDDNADAAQTLADVLELLGHEVAIAPDGATGIARARELRPDVVICDVGLPDVDGYTVARTLRADETLRATRLVALSGYGQPEDKERAREAGFETHFTRPAPLDALAALLA